MSRYHCPIAMRGMPEQMQFHGLYLMCRTRTLTPIDDSGHQSSCSALNVRITYHRSVLSVSIDHASFNVSLWL